VFSSKCAAAVEKSQKWFGFFMIGWMILPGMIFAIIGGIVSSEGAGSGFFVGFLFSIFGGALFLNSFQSYVYFSNGFLRPPIGPDSNSRGSLVTWRDGEVLYIGQPSVGLLKIRHAGDISFIATKSRLYFGVRISNTPQGEDFYLIKIPTVYKRYFSEGIAEHISNQLNRFVGPDAACDEMKHASLDEA